MECIGVVPLSIVTPGVEDLQSRPDPGPIEQRTRAPHGALTLSHEPETLHPNAPARDHPDYFDGCPALSREFLRKQEPPSIERHFEKQKGRRESRQPRDKTGNVQLYKPWRELALASVGGALSWIWGRGQGKGFSTSPS